MKNKVILFDIDYTLFNVGKYREIVFDQLQMLLPEIAEVKLIAENSYETIRKEGWFEIGKFTREFLKNINTKVSSKIIENVWRDPALLSNALYPESKDVLTQLNTKEIILGIFSSGVSTFQKSKITKLAHFFQEEHIHIHELKDSQLANIVDKYKGKKIILVDDYIPVIEKAKQIDPHIVTVWIKRGRLAEKFTPSLEYPPDYTIETLVKLPQIVAEI